MQKGYLYQLVYSCNTCYNELVVDKLAEMAKTATEPEVKLELKEVAKLKPEQIAAHCKSMAKSDREALVELLDEKQIEAFGIEPHGFCLGCMVQCHDGHDVNELYSKLDFRCDCGNSKLPQ